jgi:hypothetical protein
MRYTANVDELDFSEHAKQMMEERGISEELVRQTVGAPDVWGKDEGEHGKVIYYWKRIEGMAGDVLKVVINPNVSPRRVVTLHPDLAVRQQMREEGKL